MTWSTTYKDGWNLLRTKTGSGDDTDHVDAQTDLISTVPLELIPITPHLAAGRSRQSDVTNSVHVMVTFVDVNGEILAPTDHTTNKRGIFDMTLLGVYTLQDDDSPADDTVVVTDSATETSCSALAEYAIPVPPGRYWVRLTNITFPTGGATATSKMQVWVKPHQE